MYTVIIERVGIFYTRYEHWPLTIIISNTGQVTVALSASVTELTIASIHIDDSVAHMFIEEM